MAGRVLEVAVCGAGDTADGLASAIRRSASRLLADGADGPTIRVHRPVDSDEATAGAHHLVVASGGQRSPWADLSARSTSEVEHLTRERLVPWVSRWHEGRRAPRAQTAVLCEPDGSWAPAARRLIARLRTNLDELGILRIDHIGSTSVEGLAAKDLIDLQVMVASDDLASAVADAATAAGFVHVTGQWHGKDRDGGLHPEQVCVDADPGRPVNINIRSAGRPVARDALLFRDWLRANPEARVRYLAMKSGLAGRPIDDYGDSKEPFISASLHQAEAWAARSGWTL